MFGIRVISGHREVSPDDIEWAFVTLDALLLERALARRRIFLHAQAQDAELYEVFFWDNAPDFFSLYPADPDTGHPIEEEEPLEDALRDHTGQPIAWADDLHRLHDETAIPDAHLHAVECTRMRVDAHGIAWVCYPKHLDWGVRTSTIPWAIIEEQRLFGSQSQG
jgi:hypothetical protein